jgi:hypothetical protein
VFPCLQCNQLHHHLFRLQWYQTFSEDPSRIPLSVVLTSLTQPPVSRVATPAVAILVLALVPTTQASQSASESSPAPASTPDHGSETDSNPLLVFALTACLDLMRLPLLLLLLVSRLGQPFWCLPLKGGDESCES